jgi:hypothetical protein
LRVATETLDYVGALTQSVAVVGDSVVSVRVSTGEGAFVVPVQRNETGPGAVTFEDPSIELAGPISASLRVPPEGSLPTGKPDREPYEYGEVEVTYEGLDSDGRVIATG